jgi:hypothetical protein
MAQHEHLCRIAADAPVYYVAPEFVEWMDYQELARRDTVLDHTVFVDCTDAPTPTDDQRHYICHRPEESVARFFSEPDEPPVLDLYRGMAQLQEAILSTEPHFESFAAARAVFSDLRADLVNRLGVVDATEQIGLDAFGERTDVARRLVDPTRYDADAAIPWAREQQRFFHDLLGVTLHFYVP